MNAFLGELVIAVIVVVGLITFIRGIVRGARASKALKLQEQEKQKGLER